jgi:hypothetical protein
MSNRLTPKIKRIKKSYKIDRTKYKNEWTKSKTDIAEIFKSNEYDIKNKSFQVLFELTTFIIS